MGKSLKYVSEFTFPSDKGYSASAGKTMVKAYARGGAADVKQDKAMVKAAVQKHERAKHPGEPLTKMANGGFMNARPSPVPRGANPFANARVGSNTGQRYTPPPQQLQSGLRALSPAEAAKLGLKSRSEVMQMQQPRGQQVTHGAPKAGPQMQGPLGSPGPSQIQADKPLQRADMPLQRAELVAGRDYKKGGAVTKAPAAPAPKSDMLYSKKEVNAKNLLPGGKAPSLPRARGSVNMAKGGATCMAKGGKK